MIKRILHSSWLALVLLFIYLPVLILAVKRSINNGLYNDTYIDS